MADDEDEDELDRPPPPPAGAGGRITTELMLLNQRLYHLDKSVRESFRKARDDIRELDDRLTGGSDSSRGIIVRLDRLEQHVKENRLYTRVAIGAAITSFVGMLIHLIARLHGA